MKPGIAANLFWIVLLSLPAWSAERVALVMGNGAYAETALRNPRNDASDVAARLELLGFAVTRAIDLDSAAMQRQVGDFHARLQPGSIAVFYYSGHGVEIGGRNYLLPVDNAGLRSAGDVAGRSLDLRRVVEGMQVSGSLLNLVILDACRDNPLPSALRSGSRGLAAMDAQRGTLIAYATRAGATAADGDGRNSPYTRALLKMLAIPDLEITQLFNRIGVEVSTQTRGAQVPWFSSSPVPSIALAASRQSSPAAAAEGTLRITVEPADAQIHLDGRPIGSGAQTVQALAPNSKHRIEARKPGLQSQVVTALIKSRAVTEVHLRLPAHDAPAASVRAEAAAGTLPAGLRDPLKSGGQGPEMVLIRGASYQRGNPRGDSDEQPARTVSLATFAIGKYEVTVAEYRRYAESRGLTTAPDDEQRRRVAHFVANSAIDDLDELRQTSACYAYDEQRGNWWWQVGLSWHTTGYDQAETYPVVCVNKDEAQNYATWLSAQTGRKYRLPSEAELEFVIRAGSTTSLPWGDDPAQACAYANIADQSKLEPYAWGPGAVTCTDGAWYVRSVGSYRPNALGLYDTIGNVWEWTEDCYAENYRAAPTDGKPFVQRGCDRGVVRGGGFDSGPDQMRPANRRFVYHENGGRAQSVGFRVVAEM